MVDMSATLIHHGHIRLLKKASEFGKVVEYFEDGKIKDSFTVIDTIHNNYIQSVYTGQMIRHHENGQISLKSNFDEEGNTIGLRESWDKNGNKMTHLEYKNGEPWEGYQKWISDERLTKLVYEKGELNMNKSIY